MRRFQNLLVRRQRQVRFDQTQGVFFVLAERGEEEIDIGVFEVVRRLLHFVLVEYVAVGDGFAVRAVGGLECFPVTGEITYGLERIAMYLQEVNSVYDLVWFASIRRRASFSYGFPLAEKANRADVLARYEAQKAEKAAAEEKN